MILFWGLPYRNEQIWQDENFTSTENTLKGFPLVVAIVCNIEEPTSSECLIAVLVGRHVALCNTSCGFNLLRCCLSREKEKKMVEPIRKKPLTFQSNLHPTAALFLCLLVHLIYACVRGCQKSWTILWQHFRRRSNTTLAEKRRVSPLPITTFRSKTAKGGGRDRRSTRKGWKGYHISLRATSIKYYLNVSQVTSEGFQKA